MDALQRTRDQERAVVRLQMAVATSKTTIAAAAAAVRRDPVTVASWVGSLQMPRGKALKRLVAYLDSLKA